MFYIQVISDCRLKTGNERMKKTRRRSRRFRFPPLISDKMRDEERGKRKPTRRLKPRRGRKKVKLNVEPVIVNLRG